MRPHLKSTRFMSKFLLFIRYTLIISLVTANAGCTHLLLIANGSELADQDHSKRTLGARIEDRSIQNKGIINLYNSDALFQSSRILIHSYNGYVLLTGQVSTASLKKKSTSIIRNIRHVRRVYNELEVAEPATNALRTKDLWLAMKVRLAMLFTPHFPSSHVQIESQNGTIYLMGLLTKKQTQNAVIIIQKVYGVTKIVKLVEEIKPS